MALFRNIRKRPAVALLLVLVLLAVMGFTTAQILAAAMQQLAWENQRGQSDVLRNNAFSALEATLAALSAFRQSDGALYGPAQGWGDPLAAARFSPDAGVNVSVQIVDETGRYGLSSMTLPALRQYFQDIGFSSEQARTMTDCFLDWTDADDNARMNGGERDAYSDNIMPPNRPVKSLDEVLLIKGFKEAFNQSDTGTAGEESNAWRLFKGSASLFGKATAPNINTATPETLEVLAQRGGFDAQSVISSRTGANSLTGGGRVFRGTGDLSLEGIPASVAGAVSFTATRLRIIARAERGQTALVVDTLVDVGGSSGFPFTVVQQRVNAMLQQ